MNTTFIFNLVNSTWFEKHKNQDVLADAKWLNENLNPSAKPLPATLSPEFIDRLKKLRSIVLEAFRGKDIHDHIHYLNTQLEHAAFYKQISTDSDAIKLSEHSKASIENSIMAEIVLELVDLIINESIQRIRRCHNEDCAFYYLDKSKNQNKKYCSIRCNNVAKARRFRERQKSK